MLSEYFGFRDNPFEVTPDPRCLYLSDTHKEALASLLYAFYSNRGFIALIAPPGMGKTTLLFRFLDTIRESARTVFVFDTQCTPRELVRYILTDLGVTPGQDAVEMHEQLKTVLAEEARAGRSLVVVVDEAQNLSERALETIRLLTNFETSRSKLMQIVLAGQPELATKLAAPSLEQLRQRISTICHVNPLSNADARAYIDHRLKLSGYSGSPLFSEDALELILRNGKGVPRILNTLCFNALSICLATKKKQVDAVMIAEVIGDMELDRETLAQLPAPELSTPELSTPQLSTPELSTPELSTPQLSTPQLSTPRLSTPKLSAPQLSASKLPPPAAKSTFAPRFVTEEQTSKTARNRIWIPATVVLSLFAVIGLLEFLSHPRSRDASVGSPASPTVPAESSSPPAEMDDSMDVAAKATRDPQHVGVVGEPNGRRREAPAPHPEGNGTRLLHQAGGPQVLEDATLRNNRARLADLHRQVSDLSSALTPSDYRIERLQAEIAALEHQSALRRAEIIKHSSISNPQTSHGRLLLDSAFTHQVDSLNPTLSSSHPIQPGESTDLPGPVATTISQSPPIRSSLKDQQ